MTKSCAICLKMGSFFVFLACFLTGCAGMSAEQKVIHLLGSELKYSLDNKAMEKAKAGKPTGEFTEFPYGEAAKELMHSEGLNKKP